MKKNLQQISDPDDLNKYLQRSSPVTWIVLGAIVAVVLAFFTWAFFTGLEMKITGKAQISDKAVTLQLEDSYQKKLEAGTKVYIAEKEGEILSFENKEVVVSPFDLEDGEYDCMIILNGIRPIDFLFGSVS